MHLNFSKWKYTNYNTKCRLKGSKLRPESWKRVLVLCLNKHFKICVEKKYSRAALQYCFEIQTLVHSSEIVVLCLMKWSRSFARRRFQNLPWFISIINFYYKNKCVQIFLKYLNYSFIPFGGLIWIFVYVLAAQTSAGKTGPKFKTVCPRVWENNSRDFKKIWLL